MSDFIVVKKSSVEMAKASSQNEYSQHKLENDVLKKASYPVTRLSSQG